MALKSTVFKAELSVSDMSRHYYATHALTLARHPSETDERMMVRLLAFAFEADERLVFCKGLSDDDEPDLWRKDYTDAIEQWIEVGLPDERRLRKAAGRSKEVVVYAYGGRAVEVWWSNHRAALLKLSNLTVYVLPSDTTRAIAAMAERTMQLQFTCEGAEAWLGTGDTMLTVSRLRLFPE